MCPHINTLLTYEKQEEHKTKGMDAHMSNAPIFVRDKHIQPTSGTALAALGSGPFLRGKDNRSVDQNRSDLILYTPNHGRL